MEANPGRGNSKTRRRTAAIGPHTAGLASGVVRAPVPTEVVVWGLDAAKEVCGGLPGRSADTIHEDLGTGGRLRKLLWVARLMCASALTVWLRQWLCEPCDGGVPLLGWSTCSPTFTGTRMRASSHLDRCRLAALCLQGCPFSPLLVNSMMAAWSLHVRRRVPDIRMRIFLDDRTLYTKGTRAVTRLVEAATAGQEADAAMGFSLHPDKLASFGCHVQQREALLEYADLLGVPQTDLPLAGRPLPAGGPPGFCGPGRHGGSAVQGRRISRVAATTSTRARLASLLMVSKFRFRAPWTQFSKTSVRDCGRTRSRRRCGADLWLRCSRRSAARARLDLKLRRL